MNQLKPMIIVLLMLTSALAGCAGEDGMDVNESRIIEVEAELVIMAELITQLQNDIHWQNKTRDLIGADLSYTNLSNADLSGDNLSFTDLSFSHLNYADLSGADLRYADLSFAYLIGAYLSNADLSNADLYNADLRYADLTGADLTSVLWYNTICPDGTNSDDNGDTCANNLI